MCSKLLLYVKLSVIITIRNVKMMNLFDIGQRHVWNQTQVVQNKRDVFVAVSTWQTRSLYSTQARRVGRSKVSLLGSACCHNLYKHRHTRSWKNKHAWPHHWPCARYKTKNIWRNGKLHYRSSQYCVSQAVLGRLDNSAQRADQVN